MQNDTNPYDAPQTSSEDEAPKIRRSQSLVKSVKPAFSSPPIAIAAAIVGVVAIGIQLVGLLAAIQVPYDSQGAVGKAFAALFTQMAAIPVALIGVLLSVAGRMQLRRFDNILAFGLLMSIAALIPLSLIYVAYNR